MRLAGRVRTLETIARRERPAPETADDLMRAVRCCPATARLVVDLRARLAGDESGDATAAALRTIESRAERLRAMGWPQGGLGRLP